MTDEEHLRIVNAMKEQHKYEFNNLLVERAAKIARGNRAYTGNFRANASANQILALKKR